MASFASVLSSGLTIRLLMIGCCAGLLCRMRRFPASDGSLLRSLPRRCRSHAPLAAFRAAARSPMRRRSRSKSRPLTRAPQPPIRPRLTGARTSLLPLERQRYGLAQRSSEHRGLDGGRRACRSSWRRVRRRRSSPAAMAFRPTLWCMPTAIPSGADPPRRADRDPTYNAAHWRLRAACAFRRPATSSAGRRNASTRRGIHDTHLHFVRAPASAEDRHAAPRRSRRKSVPKNWAREKHEGAPLASARTLKSHPRPEANAAPVGHVYARATPAAPIDHMPTASLESARISPPTLRQHSAGRPAPDHRGLSPGRQRRHQHRFAGGHIGQAAEAGLVVYAGNEVRRLRQPCAHPPSQWLRHAYADNGELNVKRGETVRAGQVIAKSGETAMRRRRASLRSPQGFDAGRPHPISRRALIQTLWFERAFAPLKTARRRPDRSSLRRPAARRRRRPPSGRCTAAAPTA